MADRDGVLAGKVALIERRQGTVINVSSICGSVAYVNYAAYTASKFGLEGLTRVLAGEAKRTGVRVNAVDPGLVATTMTDFRGTKPERVTGVFVRPLRPVAG